MKEEEKRWAGSLKAEVSGGIHCSTVSYVLGTLLSFSVLQFSLCKVGLIHLIWQRPQLWGKSIQDGEVFKFLCNGGQVCASDKLEVIPLQSNLNITYWQLHANRIDLLHLEIWCRTVDERKKFRRDLKTQFSQVISQKSVKGKCFLRLRHLWLPWLHAVMR